VLRIGIDNSWKEIAKKESPTDIYRHWQRLCSGGYDLYWITQTKVIVMDVDREIILREYPLHNLSSVASYSMIGNRLCCILPTYHTRISQFNIYYFDLEKWSLYYQTGPIDLVAACGCGHEVNTWNVVFRLWINDHIIFRVTLPKSRTENLIPCIENIHFCYNVKTKQSTKIEDIDVGNFEVWLHTNSLVRLPSSPV
jgi:hypothetical protein